MSAPLRYTPETLAELTAAIKAALEAGQIPLSKPNVTVTTQYDHENSFVEMRGDIEWRDE